MSCPIHDSSRPESLSLFTKGNKYVGNFVCWTNHCEQDVKRGAINLIQQILSKQQKKEVKLGEVVEWIKNTTNCEVPEITIQSKERRTFVNYVDRLSDKPKANGKVTREYIRSNLVLPAKYYVDRGYEERTLDKYDVGFCNTPKTQMYMRVVVPVYNDNYMIGCVGRSINPECPMCGKYHHKNKLCPSNRIEERWAEKWVNSEGFTSGHSLYNLWFAKEAIEATGKAVLVEGQGDVWRLDEANIHVGLGMFGCSLTDTQASLLEVLPISDLYLALDEDEAGLKGANDIVEKYSRYYNIHRIRMPNKDFGDMSITEVQKLFKGLL